MSIQLKSTLGPENYYPTKAILELEMNILL